MRAGKNISMAAVAGLAALSSTSTTKAEPIAVIDRTRPLVPMQSYVPPSDLDNDPNYFYPDEYRILNCWECFEAEGRICIDQGHNSLYHHTGSSDRGNAFCCKPGSTHPYCTSGSVHSHEGEEGIETLCSPQSKGAVNADFEKVLTSQSRNHQLFAFCPAISHQRCGIASTTGTSTDMTLKAGTDKQTVYSNTMKYKKPNAEDTSSSYDACYYEVTLDEALLKDYNPKSLKIQFSSKQNMNVFVYQGTSRMDAKESLIDGNQQVSVGSVYQTTVDKGFLIVAYPTEQSVPTEFGFEFWTEAVLKTEDTSTTDSGSGTQTTNNVAVPVVVVNDSGSEKIVIERQTEDGNTSRQTIIPGQENDYLFYGLCVAAALLLMAIIVICIKCRRKGKIQTGGIGGHQLSDPANERSLHLEEVDEEDYKNQNDSQRPSIPKQNNPDYDIEGDNLPQQATYKGVD